MNIDTLKRIATDIRNEENNLLRFMRSLDLSPGHTILDIGCGFGAKLKLLSSQGYHVTGIDANDAIISANVKEGMRCMSLDDFIRTNALYDVLLMSHVIEHFQPDDLLKFMDTYLDRLRPGGYLIITTPLSSPYFYDDYDHIKPYHPTGIHMVFGKRGAQVQYYAKNRIELIDIWFRKGPFKIIFAPGLYVKKYSKAPLLANLLFAVLFKCSFGLIGRTDGWMGLYKKIQH